MTPQPESEKTHQMARSISMKTCLASVTFLAFFSMNAVTAITKTSFVAPSRYHGVASLSRSHRQARLLLSATLDSKTEKSDSTSKSARERGIYSRPSAAIERGSGFFIPGLEGSRIRLIFGLTVVIADVANHVLAESQPGDVGQLIAESLAAFYGALLLLQGIIEMGVERGLSREVDTSMNSGDGLSNTKVSRGVDVSDVFASNERGVKSMQRVADTIINFTPATFVKLVDNDLGLLYSLSTSIDDSPTIAVNEENRLVNLALDAVSQSRGGRVALPSEHPVSKLLPASATRCILIQKVNSSEKGAACLLLGSDRLLPSFTKNDLRWIGQLADTVKL
ncbi:hypothetical protein HJC23_001634 [Cyclotella cryptica]|uniref:Uncharacterized protein n=1 Tax=Cyclotella cryptica TaxID=29204 RepID=A0ABD3QKY0_9STRA